MVIGAGGSAVTGVRKGTPECRVAYRGSDGSLSDKRWSGGAGTRVEIVGEQS
jgi:hypothetical protein